MTFLHDLRVAGFIALRDILRGNRWASALTILLITLTFVNLVVVGGVLVGLIESSSLSNRVRYSSDIILSPLSEKAYIEQSPSIISAIASMPEVVRYSARYAEPGRITAGYKTKMNPKDLPDYANMVVAGIDPATEQALTGIADKVIEGRFLRPGEFGTIVLGANLLRKYLPIDSPGIQTLDVKGVGDKVLLTINGNKKELLIVGVLKSKVGELDQRAFMNAAELRPLIGRNDLNVDEIAVQVTDDAAIPKAIAALKARGTEKFARVQAWDAAQPKFIQDIKDTFALLGNIIGSVGVVASSITIFIIVFVNAIVRRKQIGILKAIGVNSNAIELAYVAQSLFYAAAGIGLGLAISFLAVKPYVDRHPINFPFSDGIIATTWSGTLARLLALLAATLVAGYLPAKIVVRKNTIDSILGR